ncbi:MAG: hypothetical protein J2P50_04430 [Hyphomicrobiaceae bacterium]|nr:hypothetical protein [Hyphomicrobiaceae bacterium]
MRLGLHDRLDESDVLGPIEAAYRIILAGVQSAYRGARWGKATAATDCNACHTLQSRVGAGYTARRHWAPFRPIACRATFSV